MEEQMGKKKNYNGIDVVKLLMALCVVAIHLTPFAMFGENVSFVFDKILTRAAVPFFFCSSGFFLKMKLDRTKSNAEFKLQVIKFAKRILFIYIIWTIIYLPCIIFWFKVDNENVLSFVQKCIFDGSYLHLWYLPSVMIAGVLAALLVKRLGTVKSLVIAIVLYTVGLLDTSYYGLIKDFGILNFIREYDKIFITTRNGVFFGLIFILLGFLAYETRQKLSKSVLLLIVSIIGLFMEMYLLRDFCIARSYEGILFTVPVAYFLLQVAKEIHLKDKEIYKNIRIVGVLIYLSHCWVDFTYSVLCYNILHRTFSSMVRFGYTLIITVLIAILIVKLQKYKGFAWLRKLY